MKIAHKKLWGRANEIIAMVQKARDKRFDVQANVYPYTAGQNNLSSIVPPWAARRRTGKNAGAAARPGGAEAHARGMLGGLPGWYNHYLATGDGWGGTAARLAAERSEQAVPGQTREQADEARGGNQGDVLLDVPVEENGIVWTVFFHRWEADMQLVMNSRGRQSDPTAHGQHRRADGKTPAPRLRDLPARARALRTGAEILTLREAIENMTRMNAHKMVQRSRPPPGRDVGRHRRSSIRRPSRSRHVRNPHQSLSGSATSSWNTERYDGRRRATRQGAREQVLVQNREEP